MSDTKSSPPDKLMERTPRSSQWFAVHCAQSAAWFLVFLGSFALERALRFMADRLRESHAMTASGIDQAIATCEGWFVWAPGAGLAFLALGWIPVWRENPRGFSVRSHPYFLTFGLLFRRGSRRRRQPASGSYWKHHVVRHRWLLLFIKIHFLPIAVGSFINTAEYLSGFAGTMKGMSTIPAMAHVIPPVVYHLILLIDGFVATLAYSMESKRGGARISAVETNWKGWLVCLVCYPPLLVATSQLLPRRMDDSTWVLESMESTGAYVCAFVALTFFAIYAVGAINMGLRYSNLSYRGTTRHGLFRVVRHPMYSAKICSFFFEWLPFFAYLPNFLCFLGWVGIYMIRARTEEQFLSRFEDYRSYRQKVKWRFIPGVW